MRYLFCVCLLMLNLAAEDVTLEARQREMRANIEIKSAAEAVIEARADMKIDAQARLQEIIRELVALRAESNADFEAREGSMEESRLMQDADRMLRRIGNEKRHAYTLQRRIDRLREAQAAHPTAALYPETKAALAEANGGPARPVEPLEPKQIQTVKRRVHVLKLKSGKEVLAKQVIEAGEEFACMELNGKTTTVKKADVLERTEEDREFEQTDSAVRPPAPRNEKAEARAKAEADNKALQVRHANLSRQIKDLEEQLSKSDDEVKKENLRNMVEKLRKERAALGFGDYYGGQPNPGPGFPAEGPGGFSR